MRIGFHSNQLGLRGTEVALYDYAYYNEVILNNESIILSSKKSNLESLEKFNKKFKVHLYEDFNECNNFCSKENIDAFYLIKAGFNDGRLIQNVKNLVHVVFQYNDYHGQKYAYVSKWLSKKMSSEQIPYVPHMVSILKYDHADDLRCFFNIDKDSLVFGYYGGSDSFNLEFVKKAIIDITEKHPNIYFLFMNVVNFCDAPNVIFLPGTHNLRDKISFINTCDACIHARNNGESFGLTLAEFSTKNKPIITYLPKENVANFDMAHLDQLSNNGIYYSNYSELINILINFKDIIKLDKDWNFYKEFSPENVMNKFNEVFLK
jgi:hypothetical protein